MKKKTMRERKEEKKARYYEGLKQIGILDKEEPKKATKKTVKKEEE